MNPPNQKNPQPDLIIPPDPTKGMPDGVDITEARAKELTVVDGPIAVPVEDFYARREALSLATNSEYMGERESPEAAVERAKAYLAFLTNASV